MNTTHQIWFCTETKKYEVKPVNSHDRDELYAWSPHNITAFNEEAMGTTYVSAIELANGLGWRRIKNPSDVPQELSALVLLLLG